VTSPELTTRCDGCDGEAGTLIGRRKMVSDDVLETYHGSLSDPGHKCRPLGGVVGCEVSYVM
jgi:hypothetical protein